MLPWLGWRYFFLSTAAPGNGGPLLQPRGQKSIFYSVPPPRAQQEQQAEAAGSGQAAADVGEVVGSKPGAAQAVQEATGKQ